jgi:hypothetical protein
VAAAGNAATAFAGLVMSTRAFSTLDTARASGMLCRLREFVLAQRLVQDALRRQPGDIGLCIEYARIARRNLDFPEAIVRYRALWSAAPHLVIAYVEEAAT